MPGGDQWAELPSIERSSEAVAAFVGDDASLLALVLPVEGDAELYSMTQDGWSVRESPPFRGVDVGELPVWTGDSIIASAAARRVPRLPQGSPIIYSRDLDTWRFGSQPAKPTSSANPLWTGRVAMFFSGAAPSPVYDPATDGWSSVEGAGPDLEGLGPAVWAADRLVTWGGSTGDDIRPSTAGAQFLPADPSLTWPGP